MHISEKLIKRVQDLSQERLTLYVKSTSLLEKLEINNTSATKLWETMNFRERYLNGWFGGDKKKATDYYTLTALTASLKAKSADLTAQYKLMDYTIDRTIHDHLLTDDNTYQRLNKLFSEIGGLKKTVDSFIEKVESAISAISSAQDMETLDLFTENKLISVMSSIDNSTASSKIKAVQNAAPEFIEAVKKFNQFIADHNAYKSVDVSDDFDLFVDFAFDNDFDFTSLFTLSALASAEKELKNVLASTQEAQSKVSKHYIGIELQMKNYVHKAHIACL